MEPGTGFMQHGIVYTRVQLKKETVPGEKENIGTHQPNSSLTKSNITFLIQKNISLNFLLYI